MRRLIWSLVTLFGLGLAAGPALPSAAAADKAPGSRLTEKYKKNKKKGRASKDRKARAKDQLTVEVKQEISVVVTVEEKIKSQVVLLESKCPDDKTRAQAAKIASEWAELQADLDALEAIAALDEAAYEAAIDAVAEELEDMYEMFDALVDLADTLGDDDAAEALEDVLDEIEDALFALDEAIIDLDDLCDELDGTIGDDVDVIVIIEIEE